ncbi:MAG: SH3 domain-containing protein [Chloroflexi bacterium]|nr:SH3 domain-containing protein [Chloroflexota bacterium]
MSRKVVFLSLLVLVAVVVLAGCLPRGRADLPNVPAGPAVVDEAQGGAEQVAVPGRSGELRARLAPPEGAYRLPLPAPVAVTLNEAPVYSGPGLQYAPLAVLEAGARMKLIGRTAGNGWYAVAGPGAPGWLSAEHVVVEGVAGLANVLE